MIRLVVPSPGLELVPLFPLPNVVLFPRAVLPLHVFEERYKAMTADALRGGRRVAMALLRPGWEKDYYSMPAIDPIVCVGQILAHEKLADGKYNFLLQGLYRARVTRERKTEKQYRIADVEPLRESCREQKVALLLVTHSPEVAKQFDRVERLAEFNRVNDSV